MKDFLKKHWQPLLLIIILTGLVSYHFFRSGYFVTDDGEWAIIRLASMRRILASGQFPARWSVYLNHGYGYPLFNFVYPLPYYLGAPLSLIFGLVNTIKLEFVLTVLFSGLGMYWLVKSYWGRWAGLLAAGFYLLIPFRLVNLYVRGSLGESWAMALYPWIFWAIKSKRRLTLTVLLAALILSHNVSALFFIPIVLIYSLFIIHKSLIIKYFLLALALSAFFWLPALAEQKYIVVSQLPLADKNQHFVSLARLFFSPWGYGSPVSQQPFTVQLGWPAIICASLAFILSLFSQKKDKLLFTSYCLLVALVVLMLPVSAPLWNLPLIRQVDFPWRLLGPAGFFLSLSAAWLGQKKKWQLLAAAALLLMLGLYFPHAQPKETFIRQDNYYYSNDATTTSADELMPIWVKQPPLQRPAEPITMDFQLNLEQNQTITINQLYFPGWQVWLDGQPVKAFSDNDQGLISFSAPAGRHQVKIRLTSTPVQKIANLISLAALICCIFTL